MIRGQKAAVQVSQRNADSRILKDGSPPLLAFPKGLVSTLPLLKIGICSVPLRDFPPIGRAEDYRERETSEICRRSGGSGPPLRTALQNSKLPGMFPEFVAGR